MLNIPTLKSILPGLVTMKANTAIAFVLSGVSLWLLQNEGKRQGALAQQHEVRGKRRNNQFILHSSCFILLKRRIGQACAFIVAIIGLLTLSQYLFGWNLGIDQLVFREVGGAVGTSNLGRMAPTTALNFLLLGVALLLLSWRTRRVQWFIQFLTLIAALVSFQPLIGYAYGFASLYGIASYTQMALHTVLTFIVLCMGLLFANPHRGVMRIVMSDSTGGFIARRLLLAAIAIPSVLGYLIVQGYRAKLYDTDFGLALLVMVSIVVFAVWIWQTAQTLDQIDSDRKQAQAALRESEARFRAAAEGSFDAIYILQSVRDAVGNIIDFKFIDLNARGSDLISLPKEAVLDQKLCELLPINRTDGFFEKYKQVVETGVALEEEFPISVPGVTASWLHHQVVPLGDGIAITSRDISERKQAEAALKESEERFRKFFEEAPIGICVVELDGRFLKVNKTYCEMLGYAEQELHQLTFANITHSEDVATDVGYAEQLFKGEIPSYQIEKRYIKKSGEILWVNLTATMISQQGGKVSYGLGMVEDITERKRTQEALQETNETLQALIQACPLAITVFSLDDGKVKMWNPAAESIFGWSEQEVLGRFLPSVPEDKHEEFLANLDFVRQGKPLTGVETRRQKKGGSSIDISVWAARLRDAKGNISCMSIVADISDRKRLEKEREQLLAREQAAREEAEAANRMKDEFLATLSHELRTPLNAMLGWTQMLRTRKFNEATTARALETIDRNTRSLATLIEDILDVSRIIRGKLHLNLSPVELVSVIEAAIDTVRPAAQAKEIQIESTLDPSVGLILGDANRLQQVVWNLLSNAVKFTPKRGRVDVRLSVVSGQWSVVSGQSPQTTDNGQRTTDNYVQISVNDTGKGIARNFLPYVFERFRQADSTTTRSQGGLGLGLAIVRHLVELHGGTVHADSPGEGQGAMFSVRLPLVSVLTQANNPSLVSSTVEDKVPNDSQPALEGLRVLVVDDEADARELLVTILEQYGVEVTAVATASEVLEVLPQLKPDLLVSDIAMPGEDGYSLIRKVRALNAEQGGQIPAVALTAYARAEDRTRAIAAGFQLHIAKPVNPEELAAVVANLAGRTGNS
jgi:PAS domain S-box-containing protein